jgi:hypothetical protein
MAARGDKPHVITFKADPSLEEALRRIPNRSEFIRGAILASLENLCPLCEGTGLLSPNQKAHWQALAATHSVDECQGCHETHLVCKSTPETAIHTDKAT